MNKKMSKKSREELINALRDDYKNGNAKEKGAILDLCVQTAGYHRKHVTRLLNRDRAFGGPGASRSRKYGKDVEQVLITIWNHSNRLCGKRLTPFLPEVIEALERHKHLTLTPDVREKLLSISPATVDRILSIERKRVG